MPAQGLEFADALAQAVEPMRWRQRGWRQQRQVRQRLFQRLDAAQPATTAAGDVAPLPLELPEGATGDLYLRLAGVAVTGEHDVVELVGRRDDAAGEAETDHEVFQVGGGNQHHRLVQAVVGNRQGGFLGQFGGAPVEVVEAMEAVALAGGGDGSRQVAHG